MICVVERRMGLRDEVVNHYLCHQEQHSGLALFQTYLHSHIIKIRINILMLWTFEYMVHSEIILHLSILNPGFLIMTNI